MAVGTVTGGSYVGTYTYQAAGSQIAGLAVGGSTIASQTGHVVLVPASDGLNMHIYTYAMAAS